MDIRRDLICLLKDLGADLTGIADLSGLHELNTGISVAVAIPANIVRGIKDGPTMEYFDAYHNINAQLNHIVSSGAKFLEKLGYTALAQTTEFVTVSEDLKTVLPHKTAATRAGLGWIGKCALLVTETYGSAVRISSILTDAALSCDTPVDTSRCGDCENCKINCPAGAVSGIHWYAGLSRDSFFDAVSCRNTANELSAKKLCKDITICGKCIEICPYTRRYLSHNS